jgi:hypothetical protein
MEKKLMEILECVTLDNKKIDRINFLSTDGAQRRFLPSMYASVEEEAKPKEIYDTLKIKISYKKLDFDSLKIVFSPISVYIRTLIKNVNISTSIKNVDVKSKQDKTEIRSKDESKD